MKIVSRFCGSCMLAGVVIASLATSWPSQAAEVTVEIRNFAFDPATVTINVGDTVTWVQRDTTEHNSASLAGLWRGPLLSLNETFSHTFDTAGTFPYRCDPHGFMQGSVIVTAAANQPPTVSITSPADGATFTDPADVTLEATASDPDGSIASVEFFEGRTSLGSATSGPFRITARFAPGTHSVTAQAIDNEGATATSEIIRFTVTAASAAPTVTITSPAEGASFTAPAEITVEATATDSDGTVTQVEFLVNNASVGTSTSLPFSITLTNLAAGDYTLTATATDNQGTTATSNPVQVTVNAPAGVPSLSAPARTSDGKLQFTVTGTAGQTYLVQSSSDFTTWDTIETVTAATDVFTVTDSQAADQGQRFYRVQLME